MFSGGASSATSGGDASAPSPPEARGFVHASHILLPAEFRSVLRWVGNDVGKVSVRALSGRVAMHPVVGRPRVMAASHPGRGDREKSERRESGEDSVDRVASAYACDRIARRVAHLYGEKTREELVTHQSEHSQSPSSAAMAVVSRAAQPLSEAPPQQPPSEGAPRAHALPDASEPARAPPKLPLDTLAPRETFLLARPLRCR